MLLSWIPVVVVVVLLSWIPVVVVVVCVVVLESSCC